MNHNRKPLILLENLAPVRYPIPKQAFQAPNLISDLLAGNW
jgi:hypothetical protein